MTLSAVRGKKDAVKILGLQPSDKVAILGVNTKESYLEEFT